MRPHLRQSDYGGISFRALQLLALVPDEWLGSGEIAGSVGGRPRVSDVMARLRQKGLVRTRRTSDGRKWQITSVGIVRARNQMMFYSRTPIRPQAQEMVT